MKNMTIKNIVAACNGQLVNGDEILEKEIKGAAIDSRQVQEDYVFFADKGEKVDGHDYMRAAFEKGALVVVCEHIPEGVEGACIVVENTKKALGDIAEFYREQLDVKVVGITGSVGKTTTKEFVASVVAQKYNVFKTEGNMNSLIGLPLMVLKIKEENEVAVLEMGISDFDEMRKLSKIAKPDVCVITNIGECHLEKLGTLDGVLKAKTEIFEHMNPDGSVCIYGDDDKLATIEEVNGKKPITFGLEKGNEIHPTKILNRGLWGSECTVENGDGIFDVSIPLPGKHMIINTLAASAVAKVLDIPSVQINSGITNVKAVSGRSNVIQKNGLTIIDDCYNANPESMKSALDLLMEAVTPTVAILGDMFEQGENEVKGHEEVGEYAVEKGINTIVCVGSISKKMYDAAMLKAATSKTEVLYFETVDEAIENLNSFIKKDDTVLLKASNGMKFSRILEAITSEDKKDVFGTREERLFEKTSTINTAAVNDAIENENEIKKIADLSKKTEEAEKPAEIEKSADQKEKEKARKQLIIIIAAVLALFVIAAIVFGVVKKNNYKRAVRGEVIYFQNSYICTKGVFASNKICANNEIYTLGFVDSEDDKLNVETDGKNLYYASPSNGEYALTQTGLNGKNTKNIAENVRVFDVISKGELVYISNNMLYVSKTKKDDTRLIAEDVFEYYLNDKKNAVIYRTFAGELYYTSLKKTEEATLIDEGVNRIVYVSDDVKNVIFVKSDGLYINSGRKESRNIAATANEIFVPTEEEKTKVYYRDENNSLCFYAAGDKEATVVTDECQYILGAEYNQATFVAVGKDGSWRLVHDGNIYEFKNIELGSVKSVKGIDASKNKLYFFNEDENKKSNSLYSVTYEGLGKKGTTTLEDTNVVEVEFIDDGKIVAEKDNGSGGYDLYVGEKLVARDIEPGSVKKTVYGDDLVFEYPVRGAGGFYTLAIYDGKSVKEIGESIDKNYYALSDKLMYYKVFDNGVTSIAKYNGRKAKVYENDTLIFYYLQY